VTNVAGGGELVLVVKERGALGRRGNMGTARCARFQGRGREEGREERKRERLGQLNVTHSNGGERRRWYEVWRHAFGASQATGRGVWPDNGKGGGRLPGIPKSDEVTRGR